MDKMIRQPITLDVNHMMSDIIGFQYGIDASEIDAMSDAAEAAQAAVEKKRGTGWLGWMELPYNQNEIVASIEEVAANVRKNFKNFVVLGIGGSALGPIAVQQALNHLRWNELPDEKRGGPKFYVEDNIDPERMASLLDIIDVRETCFNVITKSGGDGRNHEPVPDHFRIVEKGDRRRLAEAYYCNNGSRKRQFD